MSPGNSTLRLLVAGAAVAGVLLTGCGGHAGSGSQPALSKAQLQSEAKEKLEAAAKRKAKSVTCDDGIAGKVGATQHCVLTAANGTRYGVTATVKAVKDGKLNVDYKVDSKPMG
jgi:entry exclusion lipoprotein TrbK